MIIDAHTHGLNGKYLKPIFEIGGDWAKAANNFLQGVASQRPQMLDVALRVAQLDSFGYDYQVVTPPTPVDLERFPGDAAARMEIARRINDNMASLRDDSRGRLVPIGAIPLTGFGDDSRREVERAVKGLGLKGINVFTNVAGKPLDAAEFEPFWAQVAELDIPVYLHPVNPFRSTGRPYEAGYDLIHNFGWPFETTLALSRLVFSGIMERYPRLKVVSHHLGGGMAFFWGRTLETYEASLQRGRLGSVMPRPLFDYFSRFYYDTAVGGSPAAIRCAYEVFGSRQIVFATDAPLGPENGEMRLRTYADVVRSLKLPPAETEQILSGNILSVLKGLTT